MSNSIVGKHLSHEFGNDVADLILMFAGDEHFNNMFYSVWRDAKDAEKTNEVLFFPKYKDNLFFTIDGVYSGKKRIAILNFDEQTIRAVTVSTKIQLRHYNFSREFFVGTLDFKDALQ